MPQTVNFIFLIIVSLVWLGFVGYFRIKLNKPYLFIAIFTAFYVYLINVLNYTLFQYQSLVLLRYLAPNIMLKGYSNGSNFNIVPLFNLSTADLKTSVLNVLLFLPFGFLLPIITTYRLKKVIVYGFIFSLSIEVLQFITGFIGKVYFRVTDVNDLIFNTLGAITGYYLYYLLYLKSKYLK